MKHTIEKLKNPLIIIDDHKKVITMNGYAFMDEFGQCIIITYGENRRDLMSKYLSGNTDELHIKYHCFNLPT
jgi:hypothetical protein